MFLSGPHKRTKKLDRARLENALQKSAVLVDRYGDQYLPVFERLEKELSAFKNNALSRAQEMAQNYNTPETS